MRPWWDWGSSTLRPVVFEMRDHEEWDTFDDNFKTLVSLLCGGVAEVRIADCDWDFCAGRREINLMMKKIGPQFIRVLERASADCELRKLLRCLLLILLIRSSNH